MNKLQQLFQKRSTGQQPEVADIIPLQQRQGQTPSQALDISKTLSERPKKNFFEDLSSWETLDLKQKQFLIKHFELFTESISTKLDNLINQEEFAALKEERDFLALVGSYPTLKWIIDQDFNTNTIYADNPNLKVIADHTLGLVNNKVIDLTIQGEYQKIVDNLTTPNGDNGLDQLAKNLASRYNNTLSNSNKATFYHDFTSQYLTPLTELKKQLYPQDIINSSHRISISNLLKEYQQLIQHINQSTNQPGDQDSSIDGIISSLQQIYKDRPKAQPLITQEYNKQYDELAITSVSASELVDHMKNDDTQTARRNVTDNKLKQAYQEYITGYSTMDYITSQ